MVEYEIRTSPNPFLIAGSNPILLFSPTLTRLVLNTLDTDIAFILEKDVGILEAKNEMAPSGASGSSSSSSWTGVLRGILFNETTTEDTSSTSMNQPEGPPFPRANLTPPVIPFPYADGEVIGAESVHSIHHRLMNALAMSKREELLLEDYRLTRYQAEDPFEVKVSIIRQMALLDSEGAQALYNPRTAKGEERLERLHALDEDLNRGGVQSQALKLLKDKAFQRHNSDAHLKTYSGIQGILLNRRNILIMSMSIESMLLAVDLNFLVFSISLDEMMGQLFALLVPTVAAMESAIGLAIFVITFRFRGTIAVESINSIQGFIIFSQKSLGKSSKQISTRESRLLRKNRSNSLILTKISLRICGTVVESLPMACCAPKYEKTVQALLCRNLNVKSATLPNATSSIAPDNLITGFHFSVSERFVPRSMLKASIVELIREGLAVLRMVRIHVFLVPLARTKFSHAHFVITTLFFNVKDYKLCANSHWILVVLTSDGYSFKSLGSTTRSSTRWKFSYSLCTCSSGLDEYSCLYRYDYKRFLVPINKTSSFSSLLRNRYRNGRLLYVVYVSYWGGLGKTHVGHLLGVGCSFNLCIHLVPYLPGCSVFLKASYRTSFYFNLCWTDRYTNNQVPSQLNTSHQPQSISRSAKSMHVPMCILILSNFANFLFSTRILFVLETPIPSFLESPLTEEIEA
ncbi:LOW QUALITY PROTEIN: hypothetical protein Cgig2_001261 [Carnegiea gigantea]|uniref:ATP synthase protein MI25 n=1 Tax=Carnegiea gigantea TaxID=171969 RepID=A0A9Q1GXJ9_9CARY|nr:LOW QUALITY PROTEIN: hypothetical protein Cgig2_001261 [Carnegiea gigantea]